MITTHLFTEHEAKTDVPLDNWRTLIEGDCALLWVDAQSASPDEIRKLAGIFGLHPVAVQSCLDGYRRPHLYEFESYFYVNLTVLGRGSHLNHGIKASELHLFAGNRWIITLTSDERDDPVDSALKVYEGTPSICKRGPMYAVYLITEDLVETYYPLVEKLDDEADRLETQMLDKADKKSLTRLFSLKRRGFDIRKMLGPQRDVLSELARREFPFIEGEYRIYFQDVYNRIIRIFDMMDTVREVLSGNLDIYLSTVSNRLNEVMKVLTVAATILMTLSFITGFYGMNFIHLPWLHAPNAFRNMCVFMGALIFGMLWWFRRKHWL